MSSTSLCLFVAVVCYVTYLCVSMHTHIPHFPLYVRVLQYVMLPASVFLSVCTYVDFCALFVSGAVVCYLLTPSVWLWMPLRTLTTNVTVFMLHIIKENGHFADKPCTSRDQCAQEMFQSFCYRFPRVFICPLVCPSHQAKENPCSFQPVFDLVFHWGEHFPPLIARWRLLGECLWSPFPPSSLCFSTGVHKEDVVK